MQNERVYQQRKQHIHHDKLTVAVIFLIGQLKHKSFKHEKYSYSRRYYHEHIPAMPENKRYYHAHNKHKEMRLREYLADFPGIGRHVAHQAVTVDVDRNIEYLSP